MSALVNTRINQSKNNEQADNSVEDDMVDISTGTISVIARIDYIQRFSKQMTAVVDNNPAVYSKVARQYLANISQESSNQEMNVAFVAASSKINDIQMRCRLIEQLFANTLFDPEQSLAVSILRLAKQSNGIITVIVEHAQALSLQIKYELCQLVDTAKKTQNNINVVIFGLEQMAIEIVQHRTIFDKKVSVIDASSGQVIALNHTRFKNKSVVLNKDVWLKISLASLIALLILLASWFIFSEYESVSFAELPVQKPAITTAKIVPEKVNIATTTKKLASVSDIHQALLAQDSGQSVMVATAESGDILRALMLTEPIEAVNQLAENIDEQISKTTTIAVEAKQITTNVIKPEQINTTAVSSVRLNEQYYLNSANGFVVQITAFTDLARLKAFMKDNTDLAYYSYQKNFNAQKLFVLTSKIFTEKTQAREVMNKLPQSIKKLGSFLKPVSTIKREINTVN